MIGLGVSTLGTLVGIQFADLTTFLERQSDTVNRTGNVHDVTAFVALQREYRDALRKSASNQRVRRGTGRGSGSAPM